jgi:hypothetical protein
MQAAVGPFSLFRRVKAAHTAVLQQHACAAAAVRPLLLQQL